MLSGFQSWSPFYYSLVGHYFALFRNIVLRGFAIFENLLATIGTTSSAVYIAPVFWVAYCRRALFINSIEDLSRESHMRSFAPLDVHMSEFLAITVMTSHL